MHAIEVSTRAFYEWELRGRGWQTYDYPIDLEPPFVPFQPYQPTTRAVDDGRKPTLLSGIVERLARAPSRPMAPSIPLADLPREKLPEEQYDEIEILVSPEAKFDPCIIEAWLRATRSANYPVGFELVGTHHKVLIRLAYAVTDAAIILNPLKALLHSSVAILAPEPLHSLLAISEARHISALEFGLAREFMLPLRLPPRAPDPLATIVSALALASQNGLAVLQILFKPTMAPWGRHAMWAVSTPDGEPFFLDAPELTELAKKKFESQTYATVIRILAAESHLADCEQLISTIAASLGQFDDPNGNGLVPLATDAERLTRDILTRSSHRAGMILSLTELTALLRLPADVQALPSLARSSPPPPRLPKEVLAGDTEVGHATDGQVTVPVFLTEEMRLQHTYIIGASGTGKSTLILNLILQDIAAGRGVGLLDPHGDLVDEVLGRIPETRLDDVVLIDPADTNWLVGWNVLHAHTDLERELLASDLVAVFRRLSTSWGDQMNVVLGNAVLAFLESSKGGTLLDLRLFLIDEDYRTGFLRTIADARTRSFWENEFVILAGKKPQAAILTRLDNLLRSKLTRSVLTESNKPLNFRDIVDSKRILLAKLSQGAIGEENAALLGSVLVSKLHQVSLSRQNIAEKARQPFFLYLDEFHHLVTPSMASLFSGVRKYRLGLTVAHQDLYQLQAVASEVARAVLANSHNRFVFRVSDDDARRLEKGLSGFEASQLTSLSRGEAVARIGRSDNAFKLRTTPIGLVPEQEAEAHRIRVRERAGSNFGTPKQTSDTQPFVCFPAQSKPAEQQQSETSAHKDPPKDPGRGGAAHKYLQAFIRDGGQARGFRSEIEKELTGGKRIDVWLSRDDITIACEIAGSTTIEQELSNIRKCLDAGIHFICAISMDAAFLRRLETESSRALNPEELTRVQFLAPEEFLPFLATKSTNEATNRIAGFKVRLNHSGDPADETRKRDIAEVMLKSVRRIRGKK